MKRSATGAGSRVVIVGAGFAGLEAAKLLLRRGFETTLVDRNNYHLFQPLLYQVAAAYLSAEEIAKPVRSILRRFSGFDFRMAEVLGVDADAKEVVTGTGRVPFDYLLLAPGARTNFYGMTGIEEHAFTLKSLDGALAVRSHILSCFEAAAHDRASRDENLTFVIGGAGSTGVETAGALAELVSQVMSRDYPGIRRDEIRIILLEGSERILPEINPELSQAAERILVKKGVEVRTGARIESYDGRTVRLADGADPVSARTLIWTAGMRAAGIATDTALTLGVEVDRSGRVHVEPDLSLPGHPALFVVGDSAFVSQDDRPVPMVAPAATQMAVTAAKNIVRSARGVERRPFRYRSPGSLATIGRNAAVARIAGIDFRGFPAWVVWLVVHLIRLVGFRNRIIVLINWAWDYLFRERASRLVLRGFNRPCDEGDRPD